MQTTKQILKADVNNINNYINKMSDTIDKISEQEIKNDTVYIIKVYDEDSWQYYVEAYTDKLQWLDRWIELVNFYFDYIFKDLWFEWWKLKLDCSNIHFDSWEFHCHTNFYESYLNYKDEGFENHKCARRYTARAVDYNCYTEVWMEQVKLNNKLPLFNP